jgi:hypothetical protein
MNIRFLLLIIIIFYNLNACNSGKIDTDGQFDITYLIPEIAEEMSASEFSFTVYPTNKSLNCARLLKNGNIVIKYTEILEYGNDEFALKYNYSIIKNGNSIKTFSIEGKMNGLNKLIDVSPLFVTTGDGKIVTPVSLLNGNNKITLQNVPAIVDLATGEVERIVQKSYFFPIGHQVKNREVFSFAVPISGELNPDLVFIIDNLQNFENYNIKRNVVTVHHRKITQLIDAYPWSKNNELILMYNDGNNCTLDIINYAPYEIKQRFVLQRKVSETSYITLSPDGGKMIIFNDDNSMIVISLKTNQYSEIRIPEKLRIMHDWAWDSNSVVFISSKEELYCFSLPED